MYKILALTSLIALTNAQGRSDDPAAAVAGNLGGNPTPGPAQAASDKPAPTDQPDPTPTPDPAPAATAQPAPTPAPAPVPSSVPANGAPASPPQNAQPVVQSPVKPEN